MKWSLAWLEKNARPDFAFDEKLVYESAEIRRIPRLLDLKDVRVVGTGRFDSIGNRLHLTFTVTGAMVLPCARTLEPVDYRFDIDHDDSYSFADDDAANERLIRGNALDLNAVVYELILVSVPMRVVKEGAEYPPARDNWQVLSEDQLANRKRDEIDPRLAKLKDYFK